MALSVKHNASGLHLYCGHFPWWRRDGSLELLPLAGRVPQGQFDLFTRRGLSSIARQKMVQDVKFKLTLTLNGAWAQRILLFRHQQRLSLIFRILRDALPTSQALGLPSAPCH